jgi:hypothetical protein
MTFTIHASKNGQRAETHRIRSAIAVAKALSLANAGWIVHITDFEGRQFIVEEFDQLVSDDLP